MSPLPRYLEDRWRNRKEPASAEHGMIYWHILLGGHPEVRELADTAQHRLSRFDGLHMTPHRWLHITTLVAGPAAEFSECAVSSMLEHARASLSGQVPISITLGRVFYHPEAIVLMAQPEMALNPLLEAAQRATEIATGRNGSDEGLLASWSPHVTLCYSTSRQPAGPIIADLGTQLPARDVTVKALSLVIQRGPERTWDWHPIGEARLQGF
jgi:2'-5' RNA ligase